MRGVGLVVGTEVGDDVVGSDGLYGWVVLALVLAAPGPTSTRTPLLPQPVPWHARSPTSERLTERENEPGPIGPGAQIGPDGGVGLGVQLVPKPPAGGGGRSAVR